MITVLGADWCHGCEAILEKLEELEIEHEYVRMPPGPTGWEMVERMTGRRAVPVVFYRFQNPKEFMKTLTETGLTDD